MNDVTVLVADDHSLVRESVARAVGSSPGFRVVGQAADGSEVLDLVHSLTPDLVLLDITMPRVDGIEAATRIRQRFPTTRIVLLTMHEDEANIRAAMAVAVDGYVSKASGIDELLEALDAVAAGGSYLASGISQRVMQMAAGRSTNPVASLTPRELEVLRLLALGGRPGTIAAKLHLSIKTVKNHLTTVYAKLGVKTASQAVAEAYRLAVVTPTSAN